MLWSCLSKIKELFGFNTSDKNVDWQNVLSNQYCPYLNKKCVKTRKSEPDISIGTCTMEFGQNDIIICPHRLLEKKQIFMDCLHLLKGHVPGNQYHIVSEVKIPGGNVDYFLVSAKDNKVKDFVGIELQSLDTTGTVWPERERFLKSVGFKGYDKEGANSKSKYGMNWKMTAKTILVQLHHKLSTFEHLNKHLVLVIQDPLLEYMKKEFNFSHVRNATLNDPLHFHSYALKQKNASVLSLELTSTLSTDTEGMANCLGLQADAKVQMKEIIEKLESKLSDQTLLTI